MKSILGKEHSQCSLPFWIYRIPPFPIPLQLCGAMRGVLVTCDCRGSSSETGTFWGHRLPVPSAVCSFLDMAKLQDHSSMDHWAFCWKTAPSLSDIVSCVSKATLEYYIETLKVFIVRAWANLSQHAILPWPLASCSTEWLLSGRCVTFETWNFPLSKTRETH